MTTQSIQPIRKPLKAVVCVPGSKSLSNRALLIAALSRGSSILSNFLFAEDTEHLLAGLQQLGISLQTDREGQCVEVNGCAGHLPASEADIDCGESGTMLRFCTALCATAAGKYRLAGGGRLHQRPLAPLVEALRRMGALFEFEGVEGRAPLIVHGGGLRGGQIEVDSSISSQFASAILLVSPCASSDVLLSLAGAPVSEPYVGMTCSVMRAFGVELVTEDHRRIIVPAPQAYQGRNYSIEPDASSAGYFLAAAAICGGMVRVEGLGQDSCQGDLRIVDILRQLGCNCRLGKDTVEVERAPAATLRGAKEFDLGAMPDIAPTVAMLGLFADGPIRIRNVAHLEYKESRRLTVLATELRRLGADVVIHEDGLTVHPVSEITPAELDPHGDHRMAMALSLAGLATEGVSICDADCVSKSFPGYFEVLASLGN